MNFKKIIINQLNEFSNNFKDSNNEKYVIWDKLSDTLEELSKELNKKKSKLSKSNYEKLIEIINDKSELAWKAIITEI
tara:strand:- start:11 stop:244 length:234 start_codon:yes stop_codon:yes gene_type:complete